MNSFISFDTIKIFCQGALGAMTFGIYHQYTTNKIMELNNQKVEIQHIYNMYKLDNQHKQDIEELETKHKNIKDKVEKLEHYFLQLDKKSWWK
jgi:SMC interacting uncharacterized protein involved in chromosome segregation